MSQTRNSNSTRAVDSLNDSNPKQLDDSQRLVEVDGGVFLQTTFKTANGDMITSRRVDSEGDMDHVSKGGQVWWKKLLDKQNAADKAIADAAEKEEAKKVAAAAAAEKKPATKPAAKGKGGK